MLFRNSRGIASTLSPSKSANPHMDPPPHPHPECLKFWFHNTHNTLIVANMQCLQYVFFFLCAHCSHTLGICEGTPPCWSVEIPRSATTFEPGKFSSIFGSVRLFPIYGLVKIRQTGQLYTCRLVNCLCDFFETGLYIDIGKQVKGWQIY